MRINQFGLNDPIKRQTPPMVRGVVLAVYFADQQQDRETLLKQKDPKFLQMTNVAVDVLTYGEYRLFLTRVPVIAQRHALNDYLGLWVPTPSTKDLSNGNPIQFPREGSDVNGYVGDPRDFDGDHVLVEFLDNDFTQPIIRNELPHPRTKYTRKIADGHAVESRFRGVIQRIDADGNFLIDTTHANSGAINNEGKETPALDGDHGKVTIRMNHNAPFVIEGVDADGGAEKFKLEIDPANKKFTIRMDNGNSFDVVDKDGNAVFTIGNGAVKAVRADVLETFYSFVKLAVDGHIHPTGMGPSGPPVPTPAASNLLPSWDGQIASNKLRFPAG